MGLIEVVVAAAVRRSVETSVIVGVEVVEKRLPLDDEMQDEESLGHT